ncbi:MAG: hypothetical protein U9M94_01395 [Patescibacteria group bacterium]|nr:hypothetical protein [Patescibacteria group bacterium]
MTKKVGMLGVSGITKMRDGYGVSGITRIGRVFTKIMQNKIINKNILKEAILKVIAFFDMFDYPLTPFEIWTFCGIKCELSEILEILNDSGLPLKTKYGFYFLNNRSEIVDTRQRRYNYANRKFKRALKIARLFKIIPWIKMIAVGNSIGANNLRDNSDIDFFIITEAKRIWVTRWFCAGFTKILNLRPRPRKKRDTICLSFYITDDNLGLKNLMLTTKNTGDIYFIYWLANLVPIYNKNNEYLKLINANAWLKEYLPNWFPAYSGQTRDVGPPFSVFYRDFIDMLIGGADSFFKKIQLRIMPDVLHTLMNIDTRVVVNDKILKLYVNDRREEFQERYILKLRQIFKER